MKGSGKRICFVIPGWVTKHTGGAELQSHFIAEELILRGWQVEVVTIKPADIKQVEENRYYNPKIKFHYYKNHKLAIITWFAVLRKLLGTHSDVYYQRTISIISGATALFSRIFTKKMIFAIAHDDDVKKNFYKRDFKDVDVKSFLPRIIKWLDYRFLNFSNSYGIQNADKIIAQTNFQKNELAKNYGLNSDLIRNSYDPSFQNRIPEKENMVIWVGNMRKFKRAELFPEIISRLKAPGWKFVMIGRTYPYVEDKIKSFSMDNFVYTGQLPYDEAEEYFKKAKVLVSTSTSEGFANTFIHAWLYETLIVSLNVNPDSLFDENQLGCTFGDDIDELVSGLQNILSDFDSVTPILERAKKFAETELNLKTNVDKLEGFIGEFS